MKYRLKNNLLEIHTGTSYANRPLSCFFNDYCISRSKRYLLLQNRQIFIQEEAVRCEDTILHKEDVLRIFLEKESIDWAVASEPCKVVYENDFVFLVHKEAGVLIHSSIEDTHCLNAQVAKWIQDKGYCFPVRPIHRLDVDTSGLILYSKIPFFQPWLDKQLSEKKISRHYLAITCGSRAIEGSHFECTDPIGRDRHHSNRYRVSPSGKPAHTSVEILRVRNGYQLCSCTLHTGRTHQIRVHLSAHGFPIVNDPLYGHPSRLFQNMGLWADELLFKDPITKKRHRIRDYENRDFTYFK